MSTRKQDPKLPLGGEPRVDLLPPAVKEREKSRATLRLLVLIVILSVVAVGGGFAFAQYRLIEANARLATEQNRTAQLIAQQAEYAEAATVSAALTAVSGTRTAASAREVLWHDIAEEIRDRLPDDVQFDGAVFVGWLPWAPPLEVTGPLRQPRAAQVKVILASETIPDPMELSRRLATMTGYADSSVDIIEFDVDGGQYLTTISLNLSEGAFSGRFVEAPEEPTPDEDEVEPAGRSDDESEGAAR